MNCIKIMQYAFSATVLVFFVIMAIYFMSDKKDGISKYLKYAFGIPITIFVVLYIMQCTYNWSGKNPVYNAQIEKEERIVAELAKKDGISVEAEKELIRRRKEEKRNCSGFFWWINGFLLGTAAGSD